MGLVAVLFPSASMGQTTPPPRAAYFPVEIGRDVPADVGKKSEVLTNALGIGLQELDGLVIMSPEMVNKQVATAYEGDKTMQDRVCREKTCRVDLVKSVLRAQYWVEASIQQITGSCDITLMLKDARKGLQTSSLNTMLACDPGAIKAWLTSAASNLYPPEKAKQFQSEQAASLAGLSSQSLGAISVPQFTAQTLNPLDLDPDLFEAYDAAVQADRRAMALVGDGSTEAADEARSLWRAVLPIDRGKQFTAQAKERATEWESYIRKVEAQRVETEKRNLARAKDAEKLLRIFKLETVDLNRKRQYLQQFGRSYGDAAALDLVLDVQQIGGMQRDWLLRYARSDLAAALASALLDPGFFSQMDDAGVMDSCNADTVGQICLIASGWLVSPVVVGRRLDLDPDSSDYLAQSRRAGQDVPAPPSPKRRQNWHRFGHTLAWPSLLTGLMAGGLMLATKDCAIDPDSYDSGDSAATNGYEKCSNSFNRRKIAAIAGGGGFILGSVVLLATRERSEPTRQLSIEELVRLQRHNERLLRDLVRTGTSRNIGWLDEGDDVPVRSVEGAGRFRWTGVGLAMDF